MATRFQAASLVASPSYPNAVAWSDENLIAVASGHLITILNPSQLFGPRGLITIQPSKPFPFGVIDRKDLLSGCLLSSRLSRDLRPCVRSISWSPIGLSPNAGCLLSICTTEGRVKLYRMPFSEFSAEWVEVCDISDLMFSYFSSVNFLESENLAMVSFTYESQPSAGLSKEPKRPSSDLRKQPKRMKKNALAVSDEDLGNEDEDWSPFTSHIGKSAVENQDLCKDYQIKPDNVHNSKTKLQKNIPNESSFPLITADQYASRSAMLSSLVVSWSPIVQSIPKLEPTSTNDQQNHCSILAIGAKSGKISFWRVDEVQKLSALSNKDPTPAVLIGVLQAHSAWVTAISWSLYAPDISDCQLLLATGSSDGSLKIWLSHSRELMNSSEVNFIPFSLLKEVIPSNFIPISVVTVIVPKNSPHKMHLAVGKGSGSFDVFTCDLVTSFLIASSFDKIGSYEAHDHIVTGLVWAFDGSCLYSCSQDNSVHCWSVFDNILSEVPIPLNPFGKKGTNDVPNIFDSCFGLAVSPGNMMIAVARSFDADSLNPMYQQRSQKAAVEFFWIGGQQIDREFEVQGWSGLSERELNYWNANLLWSLNQYKDVNTPLVVWDVIEALSNFKQCESKYAEHILSKWLISYIGTEMDLSVSEILSQASISVPKMSSRQLHILNIVIRRVILRELNSDEINLGQGNLKGNEDGKDGHLRLWMNLLLSSEKELRQRLLAFSFSAILNLLAGPTKRNGSNNPQFVGIAQMEHWVALDQNHINEHLKLLSADIRKLKTSKLQTICEYVPEEQCSFCSTSVPFKSPEVAFCQAGQSHKHFRCAASMKVCPITLSWICICCRRRVQNLPPISLFRMSSYPLDLELSSESFKIDLDSVPLCPFCGILLQKLQPEFLLSTSPV